MQNNYVVYKSIVYLYLIILKGGFQAFINYNFSYTRFCAHTAALDAQACKWQIVQVREQRYMLLIVTYYGSRKCPKLVLKPLAAKKGLSTSVLCAAPFL